MRTRKRILREAMRGRLPPSVLSRGKTSAPGDFVHRLVTNGSMPVQVPRNPQSYPAPIDGATHLRALNGYAVGSCPDSTWNTLLMFAPVVLANWMSHSREGTLE
jgi:hypothetical protein